jgi:DNA-binding IclR family transcriptional regulator
MGYLLFDPADRTYAASVRLGLLGCPTRHWGTKVAAATYMLASLSEMVGMAVALGVRNGNYIQYIQRFDPPGGAVDYGTPAGSLQRLIDTPMGRTLLSLDEDIAIERLIRRFNAERREHEAVVNAVELIEEIRSIRTAGHYYSTDSIHSGFAIAATNVQAANGQWQVIGMGHRSEVVGPDGGRLLETLRWAADGLVRRMGEEPRPFSSHMGPMALDAPMLAARA